MDAIPWYRWFSEICRDCNGGSGNCRVGRSSLVVAPFEGCASTFPTRSFLSMPILSRPSHESTNKAEAAKLGGQGSGIFRRISLRPAVVLLYREYSGTR